MIPRTPNPRRRGFTLIELMTVIAIICILAAMVLGIAGAVATSRKNAKASGDISILATKLEEFKTRFGEYPMPASSSETDCEQTLFNALTGRWYYKTVNGVRTWEKKLESGSADQRHPFIESDLIATDVTMSGATTPTKFVDPWGNAYRYRYGKLNASTGKADSAWDRPTFLLISAGEKFNATAPESDGGSLTDKDFFLSNEGTTGIVDVAAYFDDQYLRDNLTNFKP